MWNLTLSSGDAQTRLKATILRRDAFRDQHPSQIYVGRVGYGPDITATDVKNQWIAKGLRFFHAARMQQNRPVINERTICFSRTNLRMVSVRKESQESVRRILDEICDYGQ